MNYQTPLERQAAAAQLWMKLTGREKKASLQVAKDKLDTFGFSLKVASAVAANQAQKEPPKLRYPVGIGGATGAAGLGAGAAYLARRTGGSALKGGVGGATIGAGLGAATGLGLGIRNLAKHVRQQPSDKLGAVKLTPMQKRLLAGGVMGLGAAAGGAALGYSKSRALKGGKSKDELNAELTLARLRAVQENRGKDPDNLNLSDRLQMKYNELMLDSTKKARRNPLLGAAATAVPFAAAGAIPGLVYGHRLIR